MRTLKLCIPMLRRALDLPHLGIFVLKNPASGVFFSNKYLFLLKSKNEVAEIRGVFEGGLGLGRVRCPF